jgi:hypothetical protein
MLAEALTRIHSVAGSGALSSDDQIQLRILSEKLSSNLASMDRNISVATQNTSTPEITALGSAFDEYQSAVAPRLTRSTELAPTPNSLISPFGMRMKN